MTDPPPFARGATAVRRALRRGTDDLRAVPPHDFPRWLGRHLAAWGRDPVFVQRSLVRDLRRAHPGLRALERQVEHGSARADGSPSGRRLRVLEREMEGAQRAVAGLEDALRAVPGEERRAALEAKRDAFAARLRALREEHDGALADAPERAEADRLRAELGRLREASGVAGAEARLARLLTERGRRSGGRGARFEDHAAACVRGQLVPELARGTGREVRLLRGVTLGAADTEIDQLVVRLPRRPGGATTVLAMVEVKRNANDLAHGFVRRQRNLAWLTGDASGYDAGRTRTRAFPTGHFDRPAVHAERGETTVLDRDSFRLFRRDASSGWYLRRLFLATREGPLWGVSGAALARIAHRVSTDLAWDPADADYLERLRLWCLSLAGPLEAPDLLRIYLSAGAPRQVLLAAFGSANGEVC